MTSIVKTDKLISKQMVAPFNTPGAILKNNWNVDSISQVTIAPYYRMWVWANGNLYTISNLVISGLTFANGGVPYFIYVQPPDVTSLNFNQTYMAYEITNASDIIITDTAPTQNQYGFFDGDNRCIGMFFTDLCNTATSARCLDSKTYIIPAGDFSFSAPITNSFADVTTVFPVGIFDNVSLYARISITLSSGNNNLIIYSKDYFNNNSYLGAVAHVATTPTAYVSLHRSDVNLYLKNGTADIPFACNQAPSGSVSLVGNITGYDNPW